MQQKDDQTDNIWISRVLGGDLGAFAQLVQKYQSMAFTLALKIVKNREEAEEVAQDAFMKAYRALSTYQQKARFSTWFYRIVYTTALNHLKKKKINTVPVDDPLLQHENLQEHHNQLDALTTAEQKQYLGLALERLAGEDSFLLTLFYLEESPIADISQITGISEGNVKVKLFRARKKLHTVLSQLLKKEIKEIL
jgi:RNA polymerase sigma factor (sigma-70 family)